MKKACKEVGFVRYREIYIFIYKRSRYTSDVRHNTLVTDDADEKLSTETHFCTERKKKQKLILDTTLVQSSSSSRHGKKVETGPTWKNGRSMEKFKSQITLPANHDWITLDYP